MEKLGAVLLTLMCVSSVWFSRISGAVVEIRVRPGDKATLYCDRAWRSGFIKVWFRNCSHHHQPPLIITVEDIKKGVFSRYSFVWNASKKIQGLLIKSVSEADLGLYYCAVHEKTGSLDVYHHEKRATQLSLFDRPTTIPYADLPRTTSTPPVSDCSVCWKLLVSVCPVCVLLSSMLPSTCVYFICRSRNKVMNKDIQEERDKTQDLSRNRSKVGGEDDVCYASLDLPTRGQKRLKKKKRTESTDFSIYSEVKL